MNTNPPNDTTISNECKLPRIINIQRDLKTGLVRTSTGKTFPVTLQDWLVNGIMSRDFVELKKSAVTGEWIVTNYFVDPEMYWRTEEEAIEYEIRQTSLNDFDCEV